MLRNYKFTVAYDGSRYLGWEHQPGCDLTIQGKLESVLGEMTQTSVEVLGAGRTDAGVHARAMCCNAHLDTSLSEQEIKTYMNRYLPDDIVVREVVVCSDRFHSRYNAMGKTYLYTCYIGKEKPLFLRKYVYSPEKSLNLDAMRSAAELLCGTHDFKSFCGNPKMKKSTVRKVDEIQIIQKGNLVQFYYHGTGFLQHMVRIMTGTLLEVGMGTRSPESIEDLFDNPDRSKAGFTAPAKGLMLIRVDYANNAGIHTVKDPYLF